MFHKYLIDGQEFAVNLQNIDSFSLGKNEILSDKYNDLTKSQKWYQDGYSLISSSIFFNKEEIKNAVKNYITTIISNEFPEINLTGFSLETYHDYVADDQHAIVMSKTRRIDPINFGFDSSKLLAVFSQYFHSELTFHNSVANDSQWIIARINRPNTISFNPAHKDVYENYDSYHAIPRMINIWIPICGVFNNSGLPVAPGSHLIPESEILRTKAGSFLNNQAYSVNSILSWAQDVSLKTLIPNENEMIVFSSHLIHGLAHNWHSDLTRISLEFRLFAKSC